MSTVAFDTLKLARALRDNAKFTPEQAEGAAAAISDAIQTDLATKADVALLSTKDDLNRFATKEDLSRLATKEELKLFATKDDLNRFATKEDLDRFSTKADLAEMKYEITRLFIGTICFQTLAVLGTILAVLRYAHF